MPPALKHHEQLPCCLSAAFNTSSPVAGSHIIHSRQSVREHKTHRPCLLQISNTSTAPLQRVYNYKHLCKGEQSAANPEKKGAQFLSGVVTCKLQTRRQRVKTGIAFLAPASLGNILLQPP